MTQVKREFYTLLGRHVTRTYKSQSYSYSSFFFSFVFFFSVTLFGIFVFLLKYCMYTRLHTDSQKWATNYLVIGNMKLGIQIRYLIKKITENFWSKIVIRAWRSNNERLTQVWMDFFKEINNTYTMQKYFFVCQVNNNYQNLNWSFLGR